MKLFVASALLAMGYSASRLISKQNVEDVHGHVRDHDADDNIIDAITGFSNPVNIIVDVGVDADAPTTQQRVLADIGILHPSYSYEHERSTHDNDRRLATPCTSPTVNCTDGVDDSSPPQSCDFACGSGCCEGTLACDGFTGTICSDGKSCMGDKSCYKANMKSVTSGCNGTWACSYAGYNGGYIGEVSNSCQGDKSCMKAAEDGGNISAIVGSCHGLEACKYAAEGRYDDEAVIGGKIISIVDSCIGFRSCWNVAYDEGYIGYISSSCWGDTHSDTCRSAAVYGGSIVGILRSCNGTRACSYIADVEASIGVISDSCDGYKACYGAAYQEAEIGNITSSCNGASSCFYVAANSGDIVGIQDACNAYKACYNVARNDISLNGRELYNCCNAIGSCADADGTTLPQECATPTSPPSKSPTGAPTKSRKPSNRVIRGKRRKRGKAGGRI